MKFDKLGWIVAAGMAGAIFVTGFQGTAPKFANVDVQKLFQDSPLTKKDNALLQTFGSARTKALQFIQQNHAMAPGDAVRYADLTTRDPISPSDQTVIAQIEKDAIAAGDKQKELVQKQSPSKPDLDALADFKTRTDQNGALYSQLAQKFEKEIADKQVVMRNEVFDKVRAAIKDVATKQGYSVVFNVDNAPFAANDLTPDVLKAISK